MASVSLALPLAFSKDGRQRWAEFLNPPQKTDLQTELASTFVMDPVRGVQPVAREDRYARERMIVLEQRLAELEDSLTSVVRTVDNVSDEASTARMAYDSTSARIARIEADFGSITASISPRDSGMADRNSSAAMASGDNMARRRVTSQPINEMDASAMALPTPLPPTPTASSQHVVTHSSPPQFGYSRPASDNEPFPDSHANSAARASAPKDTTRTTARQKKDTTRTTARQKIAALNQHLQRFQPMAQDPVHPLAPRLQHANGSIQRIINSAQSAHNRAVNTVSRDVTASSHDVTASLSPAQHGTRNIEQAAVNFGDNIRAQHNGTQRSSTPTRRAAAHSGGRPATSVQIQTVQPSQPGANIIERAIGTPIAAQLIKPPQTPHAQNGNQLRNSHRPPQKSGSMIDPRAAIPMPPARPTVSADQSDLTVVANNQPSTPQLVQSQFGIILGRGHDVQALSRVWHRLERDRPDIAAALEPRLRIEQTTQGIELTLLAGPMRNAELATQLCGIVQPHSSQCRPTLFAGHPFYNR